MPQINHVATYAVTTQQWTMQCHVIILGTTGTIYIFHRYKIDKRKEIIKEERKTNETNRKRKKKKKKLEQSVVPPPQKERWPTLEK